MIDKEYDEAFLDMADAAAVKGTCLRLKVGCIIVRECEDHGEPHIIGIGFNTSPEGTPTCQEEHECLKNDEGRCIRTIHAEQMAILNSPKEFLKGATLYSTHEPCEHCAKVIQHVGIKDVVYKHPYKNSYNSHFRENVRYTQWV